MCLVYLPTVVYFSAYTNVNGTVYPNCAGVPLRIYSLAHTKLKCSKISTLHNCQIKMQLKYSVLKYYVLIQVSRLGNYHS